MVLNHLQVLGWSSKVDLLTSKYQIFFSQRPSPPSTWKSLEGFPIDLIDTEKVMGSCEETQICTLPETNIAMENLAFWWYLPGKMGFSWAMLVSGSVPFFSSWLVTSPFFVFGRGNQIVLLFFFSHWMRKIYMFQWSPLFPELLWIHLFRNRWINLFRQISPPKSNPKKIWHFPLMKLSRKLRVLTASRDWPIQAAITAKMESTETSVMAGYVGVEPKIGGNPSKWMVYNGKSLLKWMIWGENPLFSETSMCL